MEVRLQPLWADVDWTSDPDWEWRTGATDPPQLREAYDGGAIGE